LTLKRDLTHEPKRDRLAVSFVPTSDLGPKGADSHSLGCEYEWGLLDSVVQQAPCFPL